MIHRSVLSLIAMTLTTTLLLVISRDAHAQNADTIAASVELATDDIQKPILISGKHEETFTSGDGQVHLIVGRATLTQGNFKLSGTNLAVFVSRTDSGLKSECTAKTSPLIRVMAIEIRRLKPFDWNHCWHLNSMLKIRHRAARIILCSARR